MQESPDPTVRRPDPPNLFQPLTPFLQAIKASAAMCLTAMDQPQSAQRVVMQMPGDSAPGEEAAYLRSLVSTARVAGEGGRLGAMGERSPVFCPRDAVQLSYLLRRAFCLMW